MIADCVYEELFGGILMAAFHENNARLTRQRSSKSNVQKASTSPLK